MNLKLNQNARVRVAAIKDAAGNPALVDGNRLSWSVAGDLALGSLQVSEDGREALFVRSGAVGSCVVEVRGDADLSEGVKEIVGQVEIVCLGGEAVVFELEALAEDVVAAPAPEEVVAPAP